MCRCCLCFWPGKSPRNIQLPETQAQKKKVGLKTTIWGIDNSPLDTSIPEPEYSHSTCTLMYQRSRYSSSFNACCRRYWELLKKELIFKWGRATPLRRYDKKYIPNLI
ncbi:hypothetical protein VP01_848g3 [Puccinia sorghi]|uniref:Uncharacterized protein n=1 Tax=Puccinia sorghi TaxID=27349 RepID=A0A0L6U9X7_9BASI|nr:hypothetical protein VP01_848g3 [Puccinia sorghi]